MAEAGTVRIHAQIIAPATPHRTAESRFVALQAREDEIRRFERQMREAVRFASVDMLRDFDAEGAGWPT